MERDARRGFRKGGKGGNGYRRPQGGEVNIPLDPVDPEMVLSRVADLGSRFVVGGKEEVQKNCMINWERRGEGTPERHKMLFLRPCCTRPLVEKGLEQYKFY